MNAFKLCEKCKLIDKMYFESDNNMKATAILLTKMEEWLKSLTQPVKHIFLSLISKMLTVSTTCALLYMLENCCDTKEKLNSPATIGIEGPRY